MNYQSDRETMNVPQFYQEFNLSDIYSWLEKKAVEELDKNTLENLLDKAVDELKNWVPKKNYVFKELDILKIELTKKEIDNQQLKIVQRDFGNAIYSHLFFGI